MNVQGIAGADPREAASCPVVAPGANGSSAAWIARMGATFILLACAAFFAVRTIHWPLVGDPAITHYVAFLLAHGMAPYRQVTDINLPGSFLLDSAVMHTLGGGALAWRTFDLLLLIAMTLAMIAMARDWFAGLVAGVSIAAIHGADGIFNMGQRDFVIAVLVLAGYAALLRATRGEAPAWTLIFGLCAGAAATIKPTFIVLGPLVLIALAISRHRLGLPWRRFVLWAWRRSCCSSFPCRCGRRTVTTDGTPGSWRISTAT